MKGKTTAMAARKSAPALGPPTRIQETSRLDLKFAAEQLVATGSTDLWHALVAAVRETVGRLNRYWKMGVLFEQTSAESLVVTAPGDSASRSILTLHLAFDANPCRVIATVESPNRPWPGPDGTTRVFCIKAISDTLRFTGPGLHSYTPLDLAEMLVAEKLLNLDW